MMTEYQNPSAIQNNENPKASVLIAFYNNLPFLKLTLAGFQGQTERNFEILICDDGSREDVVKDLKFFLETYPVRTRHLWHADQGWRKNRILNWGIERSRASRLIFIDQDCVPHSDFVREHLDHSSEGAVLCGRRMDLTPWVTRWLSPQKVATGWIAKNLWWIIPAGAYMKDNNGPKGIRLANSGLRKWLNRRHRGIVGCNFSLSKKDILRVNGFDTRYNGPGTGEDSDLEFRLSLLGIKMISFAFAAVQYHLWHPLLKRLNDNEELFRQVQQRQQAVTDHGLSQQLAETHSGPRGGS